MAAKVRILFVIGLITGGLLFAEDRCHRRYGMAFRVVDWTVGTGEYRFGISEYSMRGVAYAIRGMGKPLLPEVRTSVIYLGPAGSYRARRFLIVAMAILFSLGALLVRHRNEDPESLS